MHQRTDACAIILLGDAACKVRHSGSLLMGTCWSRVVATILGEVCMCGIDPPISCPGIQDSGCSSNLSSVVLKQFSNLFSKLLEKLISFFYLRGMSRFFSHIFDARDRSDFDLGSEWQQQA